MTIQWLPRVVEREALIMDSGLAPFGAPRNDDESWRQRSGKRSLGVRVRRRASPIVATARPA
jgi:hypothetical protein